MHAVGGASAWYQPGRQPWWNNRVAPPTPCGPMQAMHMSAAWVASTPGQRSRTWGARGSRGTLLGLPLGKACKACNAEECKCSFNTPTAGKEHCSLPAGPATPSFSLLFSLSPHMPPAPHTPCRDDPLFMCQVIFPGRCAVGARAQGSRLAGNAPVPPLEQPQQLLAAQSPASCSATAARSISHNMLSSPDLRLAADHQQRHCECAAAAYRGQDADEDQFCL